MVTTWILIIGITSVEWWLTIWMPGIALVVLIKNFLNTQLHGTTNLPGNYRNIDHNDESNNNWIWGYLAFDGWHQNHHADQSAWYMGNKWWEIDIPGIIIGILSILTLNFDNFKKYRVK
jgi:stearoyl-CoA desaturase (delta-9 desaturase)